MPASPETERREARVRVARHARPTARASRRRASTRRFAAAWILALFGVVLGSCDAPEPPPRTARNAILITCDTLRADRLGLYGYERPTSPELDAFAQDDWVFDSAYSCAPWTQPALSSLLAGRPPEEVGAVPGNTKRMPKSIETISETLRARGFTTAAIVSNGLLRTLPARIGELGIQQGWEVYDADLTEREKNRVAYERDALGTTDAALKWLATRPKDRRFFLWVHFQDPHGPYTPPQDLAAEFDRPPRSDEHLPLGKSQRGLRQIPQYQALEGETRPDVYRDRYDGEIRYFDRELGRLLAGLRAEGLLDDSVTVFTADHGEALGEHEQYFCHGENVHREQVHVPLVVRPPGGARGVRERDGRGFARSSAHVNHLDIAPTLFAALDLAPPSGWRGMPLLDPPTLPAERLLVQSFVAQRKNVSEWAIGDGRWRCLWHEGEAPRLYDVHADPGELHDVSAEHADVVARLRQAYAEYERSLRPLGAGHGVEEELDEESTQRLEALGYVDSAR